MCVCVFSVVCVFNVMCVCNVMWGGGGWQCDKTNWGHFDSGHSVHFWLFITPAKFFQHSSLKAYYEDEASSQKAKHSRCSNTGIRLVDFSVVQLPQKGECKGALPVWPKSSVNTPGLCWLGRHTTGHSLYPETLQWGWVCLWVVWLGVKGLRRHATEHSLYPETLQWGWVCLWVVWSVVKGLRHHTTWQILYPETCQCRWKCLIGWV